MLKFLKRVLVALGRKMSRDIFWRLEMVLNYLKLGSWMEGNNFYISPNKRLGDRAGVFDSVIKSIEHNKVLYLEFGVKHGESIEYWSKGLKNQDSLLHGFDSFEGLPESWDDIRYVKGHLSTEGRIPETNDSRVSFFKGWFNEVLPTYDIPDNYDNLVLMLDADLYSSTSYVLNHFKDKIQKGVYIYFDDMNRPDHEPRAFKEFMLETGLHFELIASDYALSRSFFICLGRDIEG